MGGGVEGCGKDPSEGGRATKAIGLGESWGGGRLGLHFGSDGRGKAKLSWSLSLKSIPNTLVISPKSSFWTFETWVWGFKTWFSILKH